MTLTKRWAEVEADFQRFYGLDLRVEVSGDTGCRRLCALVEHLPPDAALWRSEDPWSVGDHLAASLIEVTDMWGRILAITFGQPAGKLPEQIQIPRTGSEPEPEPEPPKVVNDPQEIAAFFGKYMKP